VSGESCRESPLGGRFGVWGRGAVPDFDFVVCAGGREAGAVEVVGGGEEEVLVPVGEGVECCWGIGGRLVGGGICGHGWRFGIFGFLFFGVVLSIGEV
jgi:hypothetical protein